MSSPRPRTRISDEDVTEPAPAVVVMEPEVIPTMPDTDDEPTFVEDLSVTTEGEGCSTTTASPLSLIWLVGLFVMLRRR